MSEQYATLLKKARDVWLRTDAKGLMRQNPVFQVISTNGAIDGLDCRLQLNEPRAGGVE